jgi:hypothetical protein
MVKKGNVYSVPAVLNLEPGTSRVNVLHAGCWFRIDSVSRKNDWIRWTYTDYHSLTGKQDGMAFKQFCRVLAEGGFLEQKGTLDA